ncbi:MAG: AraC family transcriptional regulator [Pseudomonadota bacterium]
MADEGDKSVRATRRFNEEMKRSDLILSELLSLDGNRLRASRSLQETEGVVAVEGSIDHTLVFHLGGSLNVRRFYDGKLTGVADRYRMTTMMPAHRKAEWDLGGEVDVLHLYIDDTTLKSIAEEGFGLDFSAVEVLDIMGVDDDVIAALAPILMQEMASGDPASRLMLDSFDQVIATHILRRYSSRGQEAAAIIARESQEDRDGSISKACTYLLERQSENVSLQDVSDHVGLSKFHFQRRFRTALGVSPHEYVMQARIKHVRDLLKGTMPLADVALECGFSSQQHMTNVFSRYMSISPGRYRKQVKS